MTVVFGAIGFALLALTALPVPAAAYSMVAVIETQTQGPLACGNTMRGLEGTQTLLGISDEITLSAADVAGGDPGGALQVRPSSSSRSSTGARRPCSWRSSTESGSASSRSDFFDRQGVHFFTIRLEDALVTRISRVVRSPRAPGGGRLRVPRDPARRRAEWRERFPPVLRRGRRTRPARPAPQTAPAACGFSTPRAIRWKGSRSPRPAPPATAPASQSTSSRRPCSRSTASDACQVAGMLWTNASALWTSSSREPDPLGPGHRRHLAHSLLRQPPRRLVRAESGERHARHRAEGRHRGQDQELAPDLEADVAARRRRRCRRRSPGSPAGPAGRSRAPSSSPSVRRLSALCRITPGA